MRRRELLTASAVAAVALAGCSSSDDESSENSDDSTEAAEEAASPGEEAVAVIEEFYAAYNDADLEKANALAHEEFPDTLEEEDFQEFGGIESMSWNLQGTEIVRESEDLVEVHADVIVQTPIGNGDNVDYFVMIPEDGEWRYAMYLPPNIREDMSEAEIDEAMRRES